MDSRTASDETCKNSKKTKAFGAFRGFFNFLQKPAKRKHENCVAKSVGNAPSVDSDKELLNVQTHHGIANTMPGNWNNYFKSLSDSGEGSGVKLEEAALSIGSPESRDVLVDVDRVSRESKSCSETDMDDDVFLNESYFEDDYLEDFSSSTSSGNSSDKERGHPMCCEDDFIPDLFNNLDNCVENIDKNYDKLFPDFMANGPIQPTRNELTTRKRTRERHNSMPCDVLRSYSETLLFGKSECHSDPGYIFNMSTAYKIQLDTSISALEKNIGSDVTRNEVNIPDHNDSLRIEPDQTMTIMEMFSTPPKNKLTPFDNGEISSPKKKKKRSPCNKFIPITTDGLIIDSQLYSFGDEKTSRYTPLSKSLQQSSFQYTPPDSLPDHNYQENLQSNFLTSHLVQSHQSSPSPSPSPVFTAEFKTLTPKTREQRIRGRRTSGRPSIESGYGSTSRLSSASTPHSPTLNYSTPMNKLDQGTPLSPYSLNTLDGVSKPRPPSITTKRKMTKFTFSTTASPDLKPVPEVREFMFDDKTNQTAFQVHTENKMKAGCVLVSPGEIYPFSFENNHDCAQTINPTRNGNNMINTSGNIVDVNNNIINPHQDQIREHPSTPIHSSLSLSDRLTQQTTPSNPTPHGPRPHTPSRIFHIGEFCDLISPLGKGLHPICTSSPLHCKALRMTNTTPLQRRLSESVVLASSHNISGIGIKVLSPLVNGDTPTKGTNMENNDNRTGPLSNHEKRKRLTKRRSARTRLQFDRDVNNNAENKDECNIGPFQYPTASDYVLLKRIAESIITNCPNSGVITPWVNLPSLMENLNSEYTKIMKYHLIDSNTKLTNLKRNIKNYPHILSNLSVENCIRVVLMSCLVQDAERIMASLDFVFENLPRVIPQHDYLSDLAPELIVLLLSNPRCIVKNNHGFPLSYCKSEKEVFKAVVKYVEALNRNKRPLNAHARNLLSTVADPRVLAEPEFPTNYKDLENNIHSEVVTHANYLRLPAEIPPRLIHNLVFQKSNQHYQTNNDKRYFYLPFISSNIHSLDEIVADGRLKKATSGATPIPISDFCKDTYSLRKLYFSYRRHNKVPFITKLGMQFSSKGKRKTAFITESQAAEEIRYLQKSDGLINGCNTDYISIPARVPEIDDCSVGDGVEMTVVKKAAIVLQPGEHITALSVLGKKDIHNMEVITNTGRRIRAHGCPDVAHERWVAIATPEGSSPFCLHALYGDVHKTSGRTYIRDLGAVWVSTSNP